jgi:hypothetical protein
VLKFLLILSHFVEVALRLMRNNLKYNSVTEELCLEFLILMCVQLSLMCIVTFQNVRVLEDFCLRNKLLTKCRLTCLFLFQKLSQIILYCFSILCIFVNK